MTKQELAQKLDAVAQDKEYMKRLGAQDTMEKIQAVLAEKDIKLSLEEVEELVEATVAQADKAKDGKLDENDLDQVSGGGILFTAGLVTSIIVGGYAGWKVGCAQGRKDRK